MRGHEIMNDDSDASNVQTRVWRLTVLTVSGFTLMIVFIGSSRDDDCEVVMNVIDSLEMHIGV